MSCLRALSGSRVSGRAVVLVSVLPLVTVLALWLGLARPAAAAPVRLAIEPPGAASDGIDAGSMVAVLTDHHQLFLEAKPVQGEGVLAFARRLCGQEEAAAAIAAANSEPGDGPRAPFRLVAGLRYRVPFERLRPELQLLVIRTLFPDDRPAADGWHHQVRGAGLLGHGSLWHLAEWFTGDGMRFSDIRTHNRLVEDDLAPGQEVVIPRRWLRPVFQGAIQGTIGAHAGGAVAVPSDRAAGSAPPVTGAAPGERAVPYRLEYGKDRHGEYAIYRLEPGEALYSSVVVRFTGALHASDVNALAAEIARRSDIADVTDIPVGHAVKIPFELLLPEYLPADHPRRREYEAALRESGRFTNRVRAADLSGITVILDAGHGGDDPGASFGGVWESLYVYDIKLRVKALLESHTAARVVPTTRDGDHFRIPDRDVLPYSRGHEVLTDPPYPITNPVIGVNLRWYLANSVFRHTVSSHGDPQKVVFVSIHADSLHPSLRGAMAYIPSASMRRGTFRKAGSAYQARQEWREQPTVSFPWKDRVKSEGLSRQLAEDVIGALARRGVAIHPYKPVREKIVRNRSEYVPAVLRYNEVPAKILLEVCNLANGQDRALLQTREYRQRVAEALVEAILRYYGEGEVFELPETKLAAAAAGAR